MPFFTENKPGPFSRQGDSPASKKEITQHSLADWLIAMPSLISQCWSRKGYCVQINRKLSIISDKKEYLLCYFLLKIHILDISGIYYVRCTICSEGEEVLVKYSNTCAEDLPHDIFFIDCILQTTFKFYLVLFTSDIENLLFMISKYF